MGLVKGDYFVFAVGFKLSFTRFFVNELNTFAEHDTERWNCRQMTPITASNFEYLSLSSVVKKNTKTRSCNPVHIKAQVKTLYTSSGNFSFGV